MRFAGTATSSYAGTPRIESFMDSFGPDMGEIAMAGDNIRSKESQFGTKLKGDTTARGISAAGKVEASEIEGLGQQALNSAHVNSAIMGGIGNVVSGGLGAIPTGGGGGSSLSGFSGVDYSGVTNQSLAPFGGYSSIGQGYI